MTFMPGDDPFAAPAQEAPPAQPAPPVAAPLAPAYPPANVSYAPPANVSYAPPANVQYAPPEPLDYVQLNIPGVQEYAPGTPGSVYITGLNGLFPKVLVNGVKQSRSLTGNVKIPMADGSRRVLKVRERITGFPTASMDGQVLYKHPYTPGGVMWVVFLPLINLITPVLIGGLLLVFGLHYYYIWLVKRPHLSKAAKIGIPVAISGGLAAVNILFLVAVILSGS